MLETSNRHCYLILLVCALAASFTLSAQLSLSAEPISGAIEATLVEFQTKDGVGERYYEYVPSTFDPDKKTTLIIALHGHGSEFGQVFLGSYKEYCATNDVAAKRNAVVVSPDYGSTTSWMGPKAEKDVVAIIAHQKKKRRYDKVIISGGSMGGSSAMTFTALHPELIDGVVAMNGTANHLEYERFQDAISESFGGTKSEVPLEYKNRSAEYFPERFLGKPTAITLGSLDDVVPPDSARRLAHAIQKMGGTVVVIERADVGHATPYDESVQAFDFVFDNLYAE